jgi:polysaccharide biosynthesis protein PelD
VLVMIVGQFSDVFRRDSSRLRRGLQTARRRLDALSRAHFLLELSHDRLQQQQGPAAPNLRGAIAAVQKLMGDGDEVKSFSACAPLLLELYAAYFWVEVASICALDGQVLVHPALATIGEVHEVEQIDALLVDSLKTRMMTHMPEALSRGAPHRSSKLLAVVPFVDTGDVLHGVLAIEAMPFIAFERRNLEAMAVLAGHVADLLAPKSTLGVGDQGKRSLELVIERALSDLRAYNKPATLAAMRIPRDSRANDLVDVMLGSALREIDFPYASYDPASGDLITYVLLPMSDESVAVTVFDRMAKVVQREEGTTLGALGVLVAFHVLRADDTAPQALETLDRRIRDSGQSAAPALSV